jgi:hypothetical protein
MYVRYFGQKWAGICRKRMECQPIDCHTSDIDEQKPDKNEEVRYEMLKQTSNQYGHGHNWIG